MNDILYVQFINQGVLGRERHAPLNILQNGFSTVWDECKSNGEMIWINPDESIPNFKGTVYISVWYRQDITRVYKYAKENPDSKVIIGGPIVHSIKDVPQYKADNVEINTNKVESLFNVEYSSDKWNLEIPSSYNNSHVSWTYLVDSGHCYWGKCIYCRSSKDLRNYSSYCPESIPIIEVGKTKSIWLGSLCLSPGTLFSILSVVPERDDVFYLAYTRATKHTSESIEAAIKNSNIGKQCTFVCGVEFPGNRMLKWMKKGVTTEEQLYAIKTLTDLGCEISLNFIIEWMGIEDGDLGEAEQFFSELKKIHRNNLSAKIYELHIVESKLMKPLTTVGHSVIIP